ncbi:MAG: pyridoxamine 5'-phosphate oxidase family protein [Betaproteobacteria bacterium]|nr:pyridoxamine 5'-phosphate oxidase family protein [Betaproteobacteria bacterium]
MIQAGARDRALDYLGRHCVMTLATHGPEGPWAAAVFYANDGFNLYFVSSPASRHGLNLAAHARVAATVHEDYHDWREIKGIQLEGSVELVSAAEEASIRELYGKKFPLAAAPAAIAAAFAKVRWYRLAAVRAYFVDNSAGFGHRDQVL